MKTELTQYTKVKVINCHELSLLRDIHAPDLDENNIIKRFKAGDVILVDTSHVYWDSYDRCYYKCKDDYDFETFVAAGGVRVV